MKKIILQVLMMSLVGCSVVEVQQTPSHVPSTTSIPMTITPIPSATPVSFPEWLRDPNSSVIAALIKDENAKTQNIRFFDASNGESYELQTNTSFGGFFWYDGMNFGVLSADMKTANRISLASGEIQQDVISESSTQFLIDYWEYGPAVQRSASNNELSFSFPRRIDQSLRGQYTDEWSEDKQTISVKEIATGRLIWEWHLSKGRYLTESLWSPVAEGQYAFLQGSPDPLTGEVTDSMTLTLVDVTDGRILSSFNGNFGLLDWSPDGKMILALNPEFYFRRYGVPFKDAPCLLLLATGEIKCLRAIPKLVPMGYELLTTGYYSWAGDSNSIYFTYVYTLPEKWQILGNLCTYSLIDGNIKCPTQDLDVLDGQSIVDYEISPDEQFIHFCYSKSTILNDYADTSFDGVIGVDGSNFFSWVGTVQNDGPQLCSISSLWRPLH